MERRGEEKSAYLLIAELSSSRRRASVVVLSSFDRLSILFRITSSMSLIFFSTPRDSTPPSTGRKGGGGQEMKNEPTKSGAHNKLVGKARALITTLGAVSGLLPGIWSLFASLQQKS